MKLGVMNYPMNDLLKEIKWMGENGFDFIDLTIEPTKAYHINVKKVRKLLRDYGLDVIGHTNPWLPFALPIKSIQETCLKEFKKYVDIFSKLGVKSMNVHPTYFIPHHSKEEMINENILFFKKVERIAKEKEIQLMLENFIKPFDNIKTFRRIIGEIPNLKILFDVGHANINQEKNLTEIFFKEFSKKIAHLHLSDNKGEDDDHLPLGVGNIDWKDIVKILKKYRYDKTITLEVFCRDKDYLLISREKFLKLWRK
jgi:sugar phosphate isomerase/epimerase